jgi:hypothetical protein
MSDKARMVFAACLSGSTEQYDQSFAANFGSLIAASNPNLRIDFANGLTKFYDTYKSPDENTYRGIKLPFDEPYSYPSNPTWTEVFHGNLYRLNSSITLHKNGQAVTTK